MATAKRSDPVRLFARRLGLLALLIVVLTVFSAVWDVYKKERESGTLRMQAELQMHALAEQEKHLSEEIVRLQTIRGREETLRQNYEMGRSGEGLIVIVEPPRSEPVATSSPFREWVHKFLPFW